MGISMPKTWFIQWKVPFRRFKSKANPYLNLTSRKEGDQFARIRLRVPCGHPCLTHRHRAQPRPGPNLDPRICLRLEWEVWVGLHLHLDHRLRSLGVLLLLFLHLVTLLSRRIARSDAIRYCEAPHRN
ncbi:unnamed protein product [Periconia digitata]|uniref:Uncharacterized protein n=1 Tax=Periconia digitata TaxID=1303443 RepID=A0A9W4U1X8_9PLEO|nr:unnamed protein product [Periconia digitata]